MKIKSFLYAEGDGSTGGGGGTPPPAGAPPSGSPPAGTPPPAPPPKPFFEGLYGPDGKIDATAFDRLPDHLKPHKDVFAKYKTVDELLNGFGNAHALASKKQLTPLDPSAPDHVKAERKAHLDMINNVPKDPKGYGIARPETLPEQFWNQEGADKFALLAQKHSVSPDAARDFIALQTELTQAEIAKGQQMDADYYLKQDQTFTAAIQKQGLDADRAMDLAKRGAMTTGIDPKDSIFKNATVRLAMIRTAQLVAEDKLVKGDDPASNVGNELAQARDIMNNPANPMNKAWKDPQDPRHEAAKERVNALYQTYGERSQKRGGGF